MHVFSTLQIENDSIQSKIILGNNFEEVSCFQTVPLLCYCYLIFDMRIVIKDVREDFGKCNKCPLDIQSSNSKVKWIH